MGPNKRAQERERAAARAAAEAKRAEAERKAIADAQKIVAIWNARQAGGRALWFYPTIGAAIAAGPPWLDCPTSSDSRDGCSAGDAAFEVPRVSYKGLVKWLLQINVRLPPRQNRR